MGTSLSTPKPHTTSGWPGDLQLQTLLSDVCDIADAIAAEICDANSLIVYQKCSELRATKDRWSEIQGAASELHGQQEYMLAQEMQALSLKLTWCKARLRKARGGVFTTNQQLADKCVLILSLAQQAHMLFWNSFTLAVAASRQQHSLSQQGVHPQHQDGAVDQQSSGADVHLVTSCPGALEQGKSSSSIYADAHRLCASCGGGAAVQQIQQQQQQDSVLENRLDSSSQPSLSDFFKRCSTTSSCMDSCTAACIAAAARGADGVQPGSWDGTELSWQALIEQAAAGDGEAALAYADVVIAGVLEGQADYQQAREVLQLAAKRSSSMACYMLSQMCEQGLGLPAADLEQAAAWYGQGSALGHVHSAHALAFALENGIGLAQNTAAAVQWYEYAAECGYAPSQNNLGRILVAGAGAGGVAAATGRALHWLQTAAEQNSAAAWFNLGAIFEQGLGECAMDIESAEECYWNAAQQQHEGALSRLAQLYDTAAMPLPLWQHLCHSGSTFANASPM